MKIYALAIFLVFWTMEDSSAVTADWQTKDQLNRWANVNNIINKNLSNIRKLSNKKSSPDASNCASIAQADLQSLSQFAYGRIRSCTDTASERAKAYACLRTEEVKTSLRALDIAQKAANCIDSL